MPKSSSILFLDLDGVLNNDEWLFENGALTLDPGNVRWVNHLLAATQAAIVVSSDWRKWMSWEDLCTRLFCSGVEGTFLDRTPVHESSDPDLLPHRGMEIAAWLEEHPEVRNFLILDDRNDLEPHLHRHIQTDPLHGLTEQDAERGIEMLGRQEPVQLLAEEADEEL